LQGLRPPIPQDCPKALADLITACWRESPDDRPDIDSVMTTLVNIQEELKLNTLTFEDMLEEVPDEVVKLLEEEKKRVSELEDAVKSEKKQLEEAVRHLRSTELALKTEKEARTQMDQKLNHFEHHTQKTMQKQEMIRVALHQKAIELKRQKDEIERLRRQLQAELLLKKSELAELQLERQQQDLHYQQLQLQHELDSTAPDDATPASHPTNDDSAKKTANTPFTEPDILEDLDLDSTPRPPAINTRSPPVSSTASLLKPDRYFFFLGVFFVVIFCSLLSILGIFRSLLVFLFFCLASLILPRLPVAITMIHPPHFLISHNLRPSLLSAILSSSIRKVLSKRKRNLLPRLLLLPWY